MTTRVIALTDGEALVLQDLAEHEARTMRLGSNTAAACDLAEKARVALASPAHREYPKAFLADKAKAIVAGARRGAYGKPEDNFNRIALLWTAWLQAAGHDISLTAEDVSPMMRLMKEARLIESPQHEDSFIDLIGYTLTGAEVNGAKNSDEGA